MPATIIGILTSYFIGSIPTAYIFVKLLKKADIRQFGSGNVGATNASRILGKKIGMLILFLDMFKGLVPVVLLPGVIMNYNASMQMDLMRILFGLSAIIGHIWTVFLNFKGGKGMATMLGVLIGMAFTVDGINIVLGLVLLTWLAIFIITRIISISSVAASLGLPLYMMFVTRDKMFVSLSAVVSLLIILRHKSNLKRLFQGQEPKFFFKKQK